MDAAIATTVAGIVRSEIGQMELDQVQSNRAQLIERVRESVANVVDDWGIEVTRAEILDVNLDDATRAAMLQQLNAERARRAQVTEAEGKRRAVELAADAVLAITSTLRPSMLEFMDAVAINAVEDKLKMGLDRGAAAMMVAASDERGPAGASDAEFMAQVFTDHGATEVFSTSDPAEGEAFVAARRFAIPAVEAKGSLLLEDVGVPLPALADLVAGIEKIAAHRDLVISVIAHAGDGNTHPSVFFDNDDPASVTAGYDAFHRIMGLGLELGGTITGEHGVGALKAEWLAKELDEGNRRLHRSIKDAVDPTGILNPGKLVPDRN